MYKIRATENSAESSYVDLRTPRPPNSIGGCFLYKGGKNDITSKYKGKSTRRFAKTSLVGGKKYEPLFGKSLSNPENKEILDALVLDMLLALARTLKTSYPYKFPQTPENIVDAMLFGINKTHKIKEEQEIVKQIFSSIESVEPKDIKHDIENKVYHMYKETHNNEPLRNFLVTIMWITIAVVVLAVIF